MNWRAEDGVPWLEADLAGEAKVVFSTREGGVSSGPFESLNLGILTEDRREDVIELAARVMARAVTAEISEYFQTRHTAAGIRIHLGVQVTSIESDGDKVTGVSLNDGIAIDTFEKRTGVLRSEIAKALAEARERGWLEADPGALRPTESGRRFLNDLIALFLPD